MSLGRFDVVASKYQSLVKQRLSGLNHWIQPQPSKFDNVVIAMSSGVDSSMSAALFSKYPNATGIYMRNWTNANDSDEDVKHCDEQDWKDAMKVAKYLNIPLNLVNFEQEYWVDVFEPMLKGYQLGSTPNPDILCNKFVKFGKLNSYLDKKYGLNNYWLVMGHYSRVLNQDNGDSSKKKYGLFKGIDTHKDQSYYLSQVNSKVWPNTILPMGHLFKKEVREMASELELPSAEKPDSQGICFVNNSQTGKFKNFLKEYIPTDSGNIITLENVDNKNIKRKWGKHDGLWSYTIGQKIGISMPQADPQYKGTWFVSEKIPDTNEIVIVRGRDNAQLFHNCLNVGNFEIIDDSISVTNFEETIENGITDGTLYMQYRSLQNPIKVKSCQTVPAISTDTDLTIETKSPRLQLKLELYESHRAMAAGQYCCLYNGDQVIGSGPILNTRNEVLKT
ncbi:similar to Saccharomyces cerevisiae YDL033C SLM3 tRNA-specific 2-thiouridylase, responsible for 2-thiolation of the wobble base of mitochondrial tRNAs [Maudiozyma barnettii]|uniref:tRNA-5-taurinomethyluridine 2-sulfurtransferase n=1 Tax=Maudiozyma barnettii TaxID=61262 RepID=A0A8H2VDG2_9SACH|nr:tRNA-5-taurinomethyluridine 2-sulfurtransferase [Kazachstania barnettii]CAB4253197.1 similar to Saccharomyces cerevisiae YDL033C SLM3 tRNA-specific 2-thiouridylase, responsible for 2-thiolation of the wobble base of mitochondrial tRNAs [Kazachstania barnettii]CAD1780267.1 similar to Saccharomyces cerevisiae YDL033C SLM3 tRNA-specific 2-thiouridylase, responsible for 2-thiolation of the wobble base of mitochondrial tRNAs [Kazachstania barnettii]